MSFLKKLRQISSRNSTPSPARGTAKKTRAQEAPPISADSDVLQKDHAFQAQARNPGLYRLNSGSQATRGTQGSAPELSLVIIPSIGASSGGPLRSSPQNYWLHYAPVLSGLPLAAFYFHYPTDVFFEPSLDSLFQYAGLLFEILHKEEDHKSQSRPVILLCHGFGGILAKKAICIAHETLPTSSHIIQGVIFLGTPHYASAVAELFVVLENSVNLWYDGDRRSECLKAAHRNAAGFADIAQEFLSRLTDLPVISFYEEVPTSPMNVIIVDSAAARLGKSHSDVVPLPVDHREICNFEGPKLAGYKAIGDAIQTIHSKILTSQISSSRVLAPNPNWSITDTARFKNQSNSIVNQGYVQIQTQNIFIDRAQQRASNSPGTASDVSLTESERIFLESISPNPLYGRHSNIDRPTAGTLAWLASDPAYGTWRVSNSPQILLVTGYAGAGKSVIMSHIEKSLPEELLANTILCKYFFDGTLKSQANLRNLLCSLVHQIVAVQRKLLKIVRTRVLRQPQLFTNIGNLWTLIKDLASHQRTKGLCLLIDAIDECDEAEQRQAAEQFIELSLNPSVHMKLLITSRPHTLAAVVFQNGNAPLILLELANKGDLLRMDVKVHIQWHVAELVREGRCREADRLALEEALENKAEATFLWIPLALALLRRRRALRPTDVAKQLGGLPLELEEMYRELLDDIPGEDRDRAERALCVLQGSARNLTVDELNILVSINDQHTSLSDVKKDRSFDNLRSVERLLEGLVNTSNGRIALIHHTLTEYLVRRTQSNHDRHTYLAESCMRYLLLEDFELDIFEQSPYSDSPILPASVHADFVYADSVHDYESNSPGPEDDFILGDLFEEPSVTTANTARQVVQRFELFDYATRFWTSHFKHCEQNASSALRQLALQLCSAENQRNWFKYLTVTAPEYERYPRQPDALSLACHFGHSSTVRDVIPLLKDFSSSSGIYWAARNGHTECVEMILSAVTDTHILLSDTTQSPLPVAAGGGHVGTVRVLLSKDIYDINQVAENGCTPLSLAGAGAHCDMISELLKENGADPNVPDATGATALFWAVAANSEEAVRILIADPRTNKSHLDSKGRNAISWASEYGQVRIVQILATDSAISTHEKDFQGRTPLMYAVRSQSLDVVKFLLRYGRADISQQDDAGRNAISWAAQSSTADVLELLLKRHHQYANVVDANGWTPLAWTLDPPERIRNAHVLLRYVAKDLDSQSCLAMFSLSLSWGAFKVAQLLTTTSSFEVNAASDSGRTALSYAAEFGCVQLVQQLLSATRIDTDLADEGGKTPYAYAAAAGHSEVCELISKTANSRQELMRFV